MANKQQRIEGIIRKNIAEIIQIKMRNPNLGFLSIPEVKVSNDFSYAKVYVSFFRKDDEKPGLEILEHSKGFIRSELAKCLDTRRCPELRFEIDNSYEKENRITELLNKSK